MLHNFVCCTRDGWNAVTGLVRDPQGNLYGVTEWGGNHTGQFCDYLGCGTVFEVSPPAAPGGAWTETVLHKFGGAPTASTHLAVLLWTQRAICMARPTAAGLSAEAWHFACRRPQGRTASGGRRCSTTSATAPPTVRLQWPA